MKTTEEFEKQIEDLEKRLNVACHIRADDEVGFDWEVLRRISNLEEASEKVYEYASIAVNQIICLGGDEYCQPCENRESLAQALYELKEVLSRKENHVEL